MKNRIHGILPIKPFSIFFLSEPKAQTSIYGTKISGTCPSCSATQLVLS